MKHLVLVIYFLKLQLNIRGPVAPRYFHFFNIWMRKWKYDWLCFRIKEQTKNNSTATQKPVVFQFIDNFIKDFKEKKDVADKGVCGGYPKDHTMTKFKSPVWNMKQLIVFFYKLAKSPL